MAREALARVDDLTVDVRAIDRRIDSAARDRVRLGERVTDLGERLTEHEAASNEAVKDLNATLHGLSDTVNSLNDVIRTAASPAAIRNGGALVESWRATPSKAKVKIGATVIAALMAPDALKAAGTLVVKLVEHFILK